MDEDKNGDEVDKDAAIEQDDSDLDEIGIMK